MGENNNLPDHWSELSDEQRQALLELADGRVFWRQFWDRLGWMKSAGTIFLTLAAAATLARDGLAQILEGVMGK